MLKWSDEIWVTCVVELPFFFLAAGIFILYSPVKTSMLELREDLFMDDESLSTLACRLGRFDPGREMVTVWSGSTVSFWDRDRALLLPQPRPEALLPL